MLKSMSCCQSRECQFTRCRSAPPTACTTTNRLCVRAFWSPRAMRFGCSAQGIVAMSTDLRSSLPFGAATSARVVTDFQSFCWCSGVQDPSKRTLHALKTLKRVSCVRCTNRLHNCEMSRDPRLECAGLPSCVRRQWHDSYSVHVDVTAACCSPAVFQTYRILF